MSMIAHIRVFSYPQLIHRFHKLFVIYSFDRKFFFGTVSLIIDSARSIRILLIVCICEYAGTRTLNCNIILLNYLG